MTRTTKTLITSVAVIALVAALIVASGCQRKVDVKTGTRVVCTYDHVISDNVKTVSVPAKEASSYRVKTVTKTCDKHAQLEALYAEAQEALKKGDLKTAESKLKQVIAVDSAFGSAAAQLDTIAKGGNPSTERPSPAGSKGNGGTGTKTPGEGDANTPQGKLTSWTPETLAGYKAFRPAIDVFSVAREYVPTSGSEVVQLVIVAEQSQSAKTAAAQLASEVKGRHPKNASTAKINGRQVYFGTDGRRLAAVGFTDGAVMVAAEIVLKSPGSPDRYKDELLDVVRQLP